MTAIDKNPILCELYRDGTVEHPDGRRLLVSGNISLQNSEALGRCVGVRRPRFVIEIGMGYGASTLTILSALSSNGEGRLTSIDPYDGWPAAREVALHQVARAGFSHLHEHRQESSFEALPKLLAEGAKPDLVYIDGNHNFAYAFTDFFYSDKLLGPGGVVAFNDAGWRSVFKVIRFVKKYRHYRELDVGLPRVYPSRNVLFSLVKRLQGRSSCDRYFEKLDDWEPPYDFHRAF